MNDRERRKQLRIVTPGAIVYQFPGPPSITWAGNPPFAVTTAVAAICPDMLTIEAIGDADGWRGRVIRGFFYIMKLWPTKGAF